MTVAATPFLATLGVRCLLCTAAPRSSRILFICSIVTSGHAVNIGEATASYLVIDHRREGDIHNCSNSVIGVFP